MKIRIPDTVFNGIMHWMKRDPWPEHFNDALEDHRHACGDKLSVETLGARAQKIGGNGLT